jgi:hypothetical protein
MIDSIPNFISGRFREPKPVCSLPFDQTKWILDGFGRFFESLCNGPPCVNIMDEERSAKWKADSEMQDKSGGIIFPEENGHLFWQSGCLKCIVLSVRESDDSYEPL